MNHNRLTLKHREELIWLLPVAGAALAVFAIGQALGASFDVAASDLTRDYARWALKAAPLLLPLLLIAALVMALVSRSPSPLRDLARTLASRVSSPALALATIAPLFLMPVMFSGYGALKIVMPHYVPFAWDDALAGLDRAMFFGRQPWELTHALLGGAGATLLVDRLYTMWILILSIAIIGFSFCMPRYDRARFFLAFTMSWILLGVAGAYLMSSAGPCYAALIGASSAGEFAPLMARLHELSPPDAPLGALVWQDVLWNAYSQQRPGFGMGISAMPSLHNAIAVLYALSLARFGRPAAIGGWAFAAIILVGSVHLGWHYASDGLLAGVAMLGIWWAAGRYLDLTGYAAAVARPARPDEPLVPAPVTA
ncbi:MAG: phosphatase PAP2 family protein [Allosphingosinicella sp.]